MNPAQVPTNVVQDLRILPLTASAARSSSASAVRPSLAISSLISIIAVWKSKLTVSLWLRPHSRGHVTYALHSSLRAPCDAREKRRHAVNESRRARFAVGVTSVARTDRPSRYSMRSRLTGDEHGHRSGRRQLHFPVDDDYISPSSSSVEWFRVVVVAGAVVVVVVVVPSVFAFSVAVVVVASRGSCRCPCLPSPARRPRRGRCRRSSRG